MSGSETSLLPTRVPCVDDNLDVMFAVRTLIGTDSGRRLAPRFPKTRMIVSSAHHDPAFVPLAMDCGAWGFVSRNDEPRSMLHAVREAGAGNRFPASDAGS